MLQDETDSESDYNSNNVDYYCWKCETSLIWFSILYFVQEFGLIASFMVYVFSLCNNKKTWKKFKKKKCNTYKSLILSFVALESLLTENLTKLFAFVPLNIFWSTFNICIIHWPTKHAILFLL